jgi:hypothetical protein
MASQKERRAAPRTAAPRNAAGAAAQKKTASETAGRAAADAKTALSNEDIYRLIAEAAYFKATARGFEPGGEVRDWIEAEAEIRQRIESGTVRRE